MTITISASPFFNTLATASSNAAQASQKRDTQLIDNQIQNNLNNRIAALETTPGQSSTSVTQSQITQLTNQKTATSALETSYANNIQILNALSTQLGDLTTDATNGDSADFDSALNLANTDLHNLTPTQATGSLAPDNILPLQANGLGIGNSASYNLSTPDGAAAAEAAVAAAQSTVGQISQITGTNHLVTGQQVIALSSQIDNLNTQVENADQASSTGVQTQISQLEEQAQNQEHLIELSLGNSNSLANALQQALTPPQPINSPFGALEAAIAATPTSIAAANKANPPVLSLLV